MNYGVSVTNASKKIVPFSNLRSAPDFVAGATYAIGAYVKSNGLCYMATAAGTAGATAPIGVGTAISDGTLTWMSLMQNPRKGITIVNEGAIALYLSMGAPAVAGTGIVLAASGGSFTLTLDTFVDDCEFYAIRAAATAGNVSVLTW